LSDATVRVLAYHSLTPRSGDPLGVSPGRFRQQLTWMQDNGWHCLALPDWLAMVEDGVAPSHRSCVLTFDDGYADNLELAAPILTALGWTATVFAITDSLGDGRLREHGRLLPAPTSHRSRRSLTWDEAERWCRLGFTIGSHSRTHRMLTRIDPEERDAELRDSAALLRSRLGIGELVICYPYGDVDGRVVGAARAAGYRGGVVTPRLAGIPASAWTMHRVGIYEHDDLSRLRFKLGHLFPVMREAKLLMRRKRARFGPDWCAAAHTQLEAVDV